MLDVSFLKAASLDTLRLDASVLGASRRAGIAKRKQFHLLEMCLPNVVILRAIGNERKLDSITFCPAAASLEQRSGAWRELLARRREQSPCQRLKELRPGAARAMVVVLK